MKSRRGCTQSTAKGEWLHVKQLRPLHPSRGVLSFSLIDPLPASEHCFHTLLFFFSCLAFRIGKPKASPFFKVSDIQKVCVRVCVCIHTYVCMHIYVYIFYDGLAVLRSLTKFRTNSIARIRFQNRSYFIRNTRNSNIAAALCLMETRHRDCHWWSSTAMKIHAI